MSSILVCLNVSVEGNVAWFLSKALNTGCRRCRAVSFLILLSIIKPPIAWPSVLGTDGKRTWAVVHFVLRWCGKRQGRVCGQKVDKGSGIDVGPNIRAYPTKRTKNSWGRRLEHYPMLDCEGHIIKWQIRD